MAKVFSFIGWEKGKERGAGMLNDAVEFYTLLLMNLHKELKRLKVHLF